MIRTGIERFIFRGFRYQSCESNSALLFPPLGRDPPRCLPISNQWVSRLPPAHSLYLQGKPDDFVIRNCWPGIHHLQNEDGSTSTFVNLFFDRVPEIYDSQLHLIVSLHKAVSAKYVLLRGTLPDLPFHRNVLFCSNEQNADHFKLSTAIEQSYGSGLGLAFDFVVEGGAYLTVNYPSDSNTIQFSSHLPSGTYNSPSHSLLTQLFSRANTSQVCSWNVF